jgi:hypothetical protein
LTCDLGRLTSPRTYVVLAGIEAADAVACAIPVAPITKVLDGLDVPTDIRWILPVVKAAAAVGLLSVARFPRLARLTTLMLAVYFVVAVGAHVRVRDRVYNTIPAASLLTFFVAMTVRGPQAGH